MTELSSYGQPKPVIAIDGPAASGKGTLARKLAERLGFAYLDTGRLYRATGHEVLKAGGDPADPKQAESGALRLKIRLEDAASPADILGSEILGQDDVAVAASKVAAIEAVHAALVDIQRNFAAHPGSGFKGAILDGRDIGTVICPQARAKLFVTDTLEIRALRRMKELQSKEIQATYEAVLKDMRERDARDSGRKAAPMKPAEGAVVLDTSALSQDQALDEALRIIGEKLA